MYTVVNRQGGIRGESMDGTDRTSESTVNNALFRCRRLMCWKNESCRMDTRCSCLYSSALGTIRASGRRGVPLHRASRHAWIDVTADESIISQGQASSLWLKPAKYLLPLKICTINLWCKQRTEFHMYFKCSSPIFHPYSSSCYLHSLLSTSPHSSAPALVTY
jgi:hypothetical protein